VPFDPKPFFGPPELGVSGLLHDEGPVGLACRDRGSPDNGQKVQKIEGPITLPQCDVRAGRSLSYEVVFCATQRKRSRDGSSKTAMRNSILMKATLVRVFPVLALLASTQIPAEAREQGEPRSMTAVNGIVLHSIGGPACVKGEVRYPQVPQQEDDAKFWRDYLAKSEKADVHYIIGRTGKVESLIREDQIAYHASSNNKQTIGIELVNSGDGIEAFPYSQIFSLIYLISDIRKRNPQIFLQNIVTHSMVDQRTCTCGNEVYYRRTDPGIAFPYAEIMKLLSDLSGIEKLEKNDYEILTGPSIASLCANVPE
jgi:N-acetylmuramoyl-L-alanine amidase